jgi:hypothetical protein
VGEVLTLVPSPSDEARTLLRVVEALRPRPVPWGDLVRWLALPLLVSLLICQATGRVDRALWFLGGAVVALLLVRPMLARWTRGTG